MVWLPSKVKVNSNRFTKLDTYVKETSMSSKTNSLTITFDFVTIGRYHLLSWTNHCSKISNFNIKRCVDQWVEICLILDKQGYIDLEHVTWKWLMIIYTQGTTIVPRLVTNKQLVHGLQDKRPADWCISPKSPFLHPGKDPTNYFIVKTSKKGYTKL